MSVPPPGPAAPTNSTGFAGFQSLCASAGATLNPSATPAHATAPRVHRTSTSFESIRDLLAASALSHGGGVRRFRPALVMSGCGVSITILNSKKAEGQVFSSLNDLADEVLSSDGRQIARDRPGT